jgi:hypothetical protein
VPNQSIFRAQIRPTQALKQSVAQPRLNEPGDSHRSREAHRLERIPAAFYPRRATCQSIYSPDALAHAGHFTACIRMGQRPDQEETVEQHSSSVGAPEYCSMHLRSLKKIAGLHIIASALPICALPALRRAICGIGSPGLENRLATFARKPWTSCSPLFSSHPFARCGFALGGASDQLGTRLLTLVTTGRPQFQHVIALPMFLFGQRNIEARRGSTRPQDRRPRPTLRDVTHNLHPKKSTAIKRRAIVSRTSGRLSRSRPRHWRDAPVGGDIDKRVSRHRGSL